MKDRERVCQFYSYAGGPCDKRGISVYFREECQTCKFYNPIKGARPARRDRRQEKRDKINKREMRDY